MNYDLLYPMFAMVVLTFSVLLRLFVQRAGTVKSGMVSANHFLTYSSGASEPEASLKLSRHFSNCFEAPTLFYVVCLAAIVTQVGTVMFIAMAWAYVLLRCIHAIVHTGSNHLQTRIYAYFSSWFVLLAMWISLLFQLA